MNANQIISDEMTLEEKISSHRQSNGSSTGASDEDAKSSKVPFRQPMIQHHLQFATDVSKIGR